MTVNYLLRKPIIQPIKLKSPIIPLIRNCVRDGSGIPRFLAWIQRTARPGVFTKGYAQKIITDKNSIIDSI